MVRNEPVTISGFDSDVDACRDTLKPGRSSTGALADKKASQISDTADKIDTVFVLKRAEPLGVASTVLGVFGMVPIFGLPLAVLALIFGIVSLKRYRGSPERYKRKRVAIAGIVLGAIGIFVSLFFLIV